MDNENYAILKEYISSRSLKYINCTSQVILYAEISTIYNESGLFAVDRLIYFNMIKFRCLVNVLLSRFR